MDLLSLHCCLESCNTDGILFSPYSHMLTVILRNSSFYDHPTILLVAAVLGIFLLCFYLVFTSS